MARGVLLAQDNINNYSTKSFRKLTSNYSVVLGKSRSDVRSMVILFSSLKSKKEAICFRVIDVFPKLFLQPYVRYLHFLTLLKVSVQLKGRERTTMEEHPSDITNSAVFLE